MIPPIPPHERFKLYRDTLLFHAGTSRDGPLWLPAALLCGIEKANCAAVARCAWLDEASNRPPGSIGRNEAHQNAELWRERRERKP